MSSVIETQQTCPNFYRLKTELLQHPDGVALYEDPIFQPRFSTLFNKHSKMDFIPTEIVWNRPGQLSKRPCLVSAKGFQAVKVFGGRLSPEWFPVLFALIKERNLLEMVIPDLDNQNTFNKHSNFMTPDRMVYCGAFLFRFRRGGITEDIVIDDRLPTTLNCHLLTAISDDVDEFLPALMEKAYAKFVGGYYNLDQQNYVSALMDFTGGLVETISMRGDDILTTTELESFYGKLNSMVGDSFAICEVSRETSSENLPRRSTEFYLINGATKIPQEPPNNVVDYMMNSFQENDDEWIYVARMLSLRGEDTTDSRINGRRLNEKWNECSSIIRSKYGVIYNDGRESWVPIEELPYVCNQVIIVHFQLRNPIVALAKSQEFWKFFFYDSFWHRDGPRGDVEVIGEEFLRNQQYLCTVTSVDGCNIKVALTNTQKYVDSGANKISRVQDAKTGITIFEVERNRKYKLHSLSLSRIIPYHIDCRVDRSLIISAMLDMGTYVVVPWLSAGSGTRYTIQLLSSILSTEFSPLQLDAPTAQLCMSCQLSHSMAETKNSITSIYSSRTSTKSSFKNIQRRASTHKSDLCSSCLSFYPKRGTRISVLYIEILESPGSYKFPSLHFVISCENEKYKSRIELPSSTPQWNEHFIFFRCNLLKSNVTIQIFTEGTLGVKSTITTHTFSEKQLREDGLFYIYINIPTAKENIFTKCRLVTDIKDYLPSEFTLA